MVHRAVRLGVPEKEASAGGCEGGEGVSHAGVWEAREASSKGQGSAGAFGGNEKLLNRVTMTGEEGQSLHKRSALYTQLFVLSPCCFLRLLLSTGFFLSTLKRAL